MSVINPKADIAMRRSHVRFVPTRTCAREPRRLTRLFLGDGISITVGRSGFDWNQTERVDCG